MTLRDLVEVVGVWLGAVVGAVVLGMLIRLLGGMV